MTRRPNFLLVIADHLSPRVMGCYGDGHSATPAMDAVAATGARFDRAFCTVPLCQPSRASFWSGLPPQATGVWSNGVAGKHPHHDPPLDPSIPTLGSLFREAGYRAAHFGKRHDAGTLRGFNCAPDEEEAVEPVDGFGVNGDTRRDAFATRACVDFLGSHPAGEPFFAVADLNNPHNVCGWVGEHAGEPRGLELDSDAADLPELPPNFRVDDLADRPDPVRYLCCSHPRQAQAARWGPLAFRHYLRAYRHYAGLADGCFARIHAALSARADAENTVVILTSDHGDGQASHGMVTKQTCFYEQFMRVPLVFAGPGIGSASVSPLVSLLDLLPTFCDLAGIRVPAGKAGLSLVPWLRGEAPVRWRDHVSAAWLTEWGHTVNPGRMLREDRFKYVTYRTAEGPVLQEEMYDLHDDPWEARTLHRDPANRGELARLRAKLLAEIAATGDPFLDQPVRVPAGARQHPVGFAHH